ncbi:phosphotransferase family protein [Paenibacillus tengchongensis]|uniref:phosphotransferase family protein n=1 Tax=Paenibacillus tengchongensis TaxID=2608684 RepID=UPI001652575A|nr:phosphotransferase [Paenibacillus tengchongensis]
MAEEWRDIPGADEWNKVEPVLKGWSGDKKFCIRHANGHKLLLRMAGGADLPRKRAEYEMIKRFNSLDIPMSRSVGYGLCGGGEYSYLLLSWVEGEPLEERLPEMAPPEQYLLGVEAGQILAAMHALPHGEMTGWEEAMQAKILRRIEQYEACPYRLEGDEKVIAYVRENIGLIADTRKVYRHGDFHIGNLLYTPDGTVGVIDFNRWDSGDYAEEFYKLQFFDREASAAFARGKLDGYFQGPPPEAFWRRQALYVAYAALFSIVWSIPFGADDIAGMQQRGRQAIADYAGFTAVIPRWYAEEESSIR